MTMKRIIAVFAASLCLAFACAGVAFATQAWTVTYSENGMTANYSEAELQQAVSGMQPGDKASFDVTLSNAYSGNTAWYMTNKTLKSLEDNSAASGGAYGYKLAYTDSLGATKLLFDSVTVGGDNGKGLYDATSATEDWLYLSDIPSGASGKLVLEVSLDGETQGNGYMGTMAKLQLNFAVEKDLKGSDQLVSTLAKTGDFLGIGTFGMIALAAAVMLLLMAFLSLRKDYKDEEEVA